MDEAPKKAKNAAPGNGAPGAPRRPARAELIWEGKYDAAGRRVAPLRVALPFQTVETVNESAQDRQRSLFTPGFREEEWRNRLIWGDKKYIPAVAANGVRRQGEPHLHRPAVRHRRGFLVHGDGAGRS